MAQGVLAIANNVRMSPRKVGEVVALVRSRTVADALVILAHTPRRAADPVKKAIESAVANAVHNNKLNKNTLIIESIQVGPGTVLKRYRPAAMGRAQPYKRRSCNIRVVVSEPETTGVKSQESRVKKTETAAPTETKAKTEKQEKKS